MPMMFLPMRAKSRLRWSRYFLFVIGTLLLLYAVFRLVESKFYQAEQSEQFDQSLKVAPHAGAGSSGIAVTEGALLGRIEIKAIGLSAIIQEGVADGTLRHAVGHIPGTSSLGQSGNSALAAHRDTFFRELQKIHQDDEIAITTSRGISRYRVASTQVVEPEDTKALDNSADDILTLITCYPFDFVGSAPKRFIVRALKIPT